MGNEHLVYPEQHSARPSGETTAPPETPGEAAPSPDKFGADNRGHRAGVAKSGEVTGSGAGAGGGGNPEDFDADSAAGGGKDEFEAAPHPHRGGDARAHGSA